MLLQRPADSNCLLLGIIPEVNLTAHRQVGGLATNLISCGHREDGRLGLVKIFKTQFFLEIFKIPSMRLLI